MEKDELVRIIQECLRRVYRSEVNLLEINVHENTLNGRLARYLAEFLEVDPIRVDVEYNRHIDQLKTYGVVGQRAVVDIVVHQPLTDENNLLALECKKRRLSAEDELKIRALVSDEFNYRFGVTVEYLNRLVTLYERVNNEIVTEVIEF